MSRWQSWLVWMMAGAVTGVAFQVPNYDPLVACRVSNAQDRPAYIDKLMQQLAAVDQAMRDLDYLPPDAQRFLELLRKADPKFTWLAANDTKGFVNGVLNAFLNGKLDNKEAAFLLTRVPVYKGLVELVQRQQGPAFTAELRNVLVSSAGALDRCIQYQRTQLAKEQPADRPTSPGAANQPLGWPVGQYLSAICHVEYEAGRDRYGRTVPASDPENTTVGLGVNWNAARQMYSLKWGGTGIVGQGAGGFSFGEKACQGTAPWVPGCVYPSRSDFHMESGQIAMGATTVTISGRWFDEAGVHAGRRHGRTSCTYPKK